MNTALADMAALAAAADRQLWLILAAAFVAAVAAMAALARLLSGARGVRTDRRMVERPASAMPSIWWRLGWPLVALLEGPAAATLGAGQRLALEGRLQQAGLARSLSPAQQRAGAWAAGLAGCAVGWTSGSSLGGGAEAWLAGIGLALGLLLPAARLRDRAASRKRALLRQLPFYLDLITLSVEAGMNLGAAIGQAVDRGPPGPMRDELATLLGDLRAGRSRNEALRALADRTRMAAVSNLTAALATAQKQGASLGPILRAQAEQRRTERFLRAEKLAMEAPVKMLVPLALFIFPGTFAVLLFPVFSRLVAEGVL
jgi:tight adherence protein C